MNIETLDLQQKWVIFFWALGFGTFSFSIAYFYGFFKTFKPDLLPFIKGIDVLRGFGFFIIAEVLLIPFLIGLILTLMGEDPKTYTNRYLNAQAWFHILIVWGGFFAISLAYLGLSKLQRQQLWNQSSVRWYQNIGFGIMSWFVSFPLVIAFNQFISIITWYIFQHPFVEQIVVQNLRQILSDPFLFGLTAISVITVVPVTEEFLFRGLLQTWLKQKFHYSSFAIVGSSVIFACFHYSSAQGITNIELLTSLFILSCILGFIYERQRSLWAPVGLHGFFNLCSLLMILGEDVS